jgi:hypothetical protein
MVEWQEEDVLLGPIFTLAAASSIGLADVQLLGIKFSEVATSYGGVDLTYAAIIAVLTLALGWLINTASTDDMSNEEKVFLGGAVGLIGLGIVAPGIVDEYVSSNVVVSLAALGIETGGFWAVAYQGG